jgi:hypothetical protein
MKKITLIFAMLTLAGCDATGQVGVEGSPIWNLRNMSPAAKQEYYKQVCSDYGYEVGTDAMRDCVAEEMRNLKGRY